MEELFKQYGGPILIVVAVVALIAVITAVIANSQGGFQNMINNFTNKVNTAGDNATTQDVFTDNNNNGVFDAGDAYIDNNHDGKINGITIADADNDGKQD